MTACWWVERGIGEDRAALIDGDRIVAARLVVDDGRPRLGGVHTARLAERLPSGRLLARLDDGAEAEVPPMSGMTIGRAGAVEIVREALPEPGRGWKRARGRWTDAAPQPAPPLGHVLAATGHPVRTCPVHGRDLLEDAGWSELLDEATGGAIAFAGGELRLSPTPAMTLFDVDGTPPLDALAVRAAAAVTDAIARHDVGGSIGIDFPTLAGKAPRLAVAAAIDAGLAPPFERTAVNGFGFLQIVRPRPRASLPELLRADPVLAAARAALRTIERAGPAHLTPHRLAPAVHAALAARPAWLAELARRTGVLPRIES